DVDNPTQPRSAPLKCLRWDQTLINRGPGYFEVHAYLSDQGKAASSPAYQILFRTDGSEVAHEIGHAEFSPAHGHIHFYGLDDTGLYTIGRNGGPARKVASMGDKGRCATDTDPRPAFGRQGMAPLHYLVPSTCDGFD